MHAEPGLLGHRIDQPRERRAPGQTRNSCPCSSRRRRRRTPRPAKRCGEARRMQAGAVDDVAASSRIGSAPPTSRTMPLGVDLGPLAAGSRTRSWRRAPRRRPGRPASGRGCRSRRSSATRARLCSAAPAPAPAPAPAVQRLEIGHADGRRHWRGSSAASPAAASSVATISLPQRHARRRARRSSGRGTACRRCRTAP